MCRIEFLFYFVLLSLNVCESQVLQFGTCAAVTPMNYFDLERFLGEWFVIERFPTWFEQYGTCAYKRLQYCRRQVEIEHIFVRDGIQYVLHLNSSYAPGDDAVFVIHENNIDPVGIPLTVISSDYYNYAVVYGCRHVEEQGIQYLLAWILSRTTTLPAETLRKAQQELNAVPFANLDYLEKVDQSENQCPYYWTAHIQAENITEAVRSRMLADMFFGSG